MTVEHLHDLGRLLGEALEQLALPLEVIGFGPQEASGAQPAPDGGLVAAHGLFAIVSAALEGHGDVTRFAHEVQEGSLQSFL